MVMGPPQGDDATMRGKEFGNGDPSSTLEGWGFDVVVSLAGRWFEGRFPPAFIDPLTGEEYSGSGVLSFCRSSPDGDLLLTDNGVSSSTSSTDVVACVTFLDVRKG